MKEVYVTGNRSTFELAISNLIPNKMVFAAEIHLIYKCS